MSLPFDPRKLIVGFANENPDVKALQFIRDDPESIIFSQIGDNGMVNYLFKVESGKTKDVRIVIKYGEETMRLIPDEKVSLERQELEYNCLCLMQSIQPHSAPDPLCFDKQHNMLAMSDMSDWELMGVQLERGHVDMEAASHLGHLFRKLHDETSYFNVSVAKWESMMRTFNHEEPKKYMRDFTFDAPLDDSNPWTVIAECNSKVYHNYVRDIRRLKLQEKLHELFDMKLCFVHGDCHYKSVFVKEGKSALLDFEFAFLGHPAYHVAYPVASYLIASIREECLNTAPETELAGDEFRRLCRLAIMNFMEAYMSGEEGRVTKEENKDTFLSEVMLFIGITLFMIGAAEQMDILFAGLNDQIRGCLMYTGFNFMIHHEQVQTLQHFRDTVHLT